MTEYVNYKTAPIGTVAADEFTTLVKNDKGWYWLEDNLQEGDIHVMPREVVHEFQLGEVVTPETLGWLPPGSEITPERKDHAWVRGTRGWVWADVVPGCQPDAVVTGWVASSTHTLTKFPGLEKDPYVVGATLEGEDAYEGAPEGTLVLFEDCGGTERFKLANGEWRRLSNPLIEVTPNDLRMERTITGFLAPWEVELLTTPPRENPREQGDKFVKYTYNVEKGTVYATNPHRDFGKVVELADGRFLAVPNRVSKKFKTAQEAAEWLI